MTQSSSLGISVYQGGDDAPREAQLKAYQAAMWTGFWFGILCGCWTVLDLVYKRTDVYWDFSQVR
jgi:hypothetical protein